MMCLAPLWSIVMCAVGSSIIVLGHCGDAALTHTDGESVRGTILCFIFEWYVCVDASRQARLLACGGIAYIAVIYELGVVVGLFVVECVELPLRASLVLCEMASIDDIAGATTRVYNVLLPDSGALHTSRGAHKYVAPRCVSYVI